MHFSVNPSESRAVVSSGSSFIFLFVALVSIGRTFSSVFFGLGLCGGFGSVIRFGFVEPTGLWTMQSDFGEVLGVRNIDKAFLLGRTIGEDISGGVTS